MIRRAVVLAMLVLVAAPARAEEPDAETRFHDAYVLEVIEGRIAEAAKAYLGLVDDDAVPARIREEARFRFAICTVLLGRPDEGRMQLAAIVADERAPASLRARAKAYLESISTLGVGTELEKKLQSLVFDLGRSDSGEYEIPAYRDFEIIGAPAIPFLEKLLQHPDVKLRRHAFRLLIRLGAEDLVARWTPEIPVSGPGFNRDFVKRYLLQHPDELPRLEAKLLVLDDTLLEATLAVFAPHPEWSFEFVRALTTRPALRADGFGLLGRVGTPAQRWALARDCILGEDEELREFATEYAVLDEQGPPDELVEPLWSALVRWLAATKQGWSTGAGRGSRSGNLEAWARRVSTPGLLASLEALVEVGRAWPVDEPGQPLRDGLAAIVAAPLADRDLDATETAAYEALVRRWVEDVAPRLDLRSAGIAVPPLRDLVVRLPADRAAALVRWLFCGPAHERTAWFNEAVTIRRPEDVALLVEAVRVASPGHRSALLRMLPRLTSRGPASDIASAEALALPTLLPLDGSSSLLGFGGLSDLQGRIPDPTLATAVQSLFGAAVSMDENTQALLFDRLVDFRAQTADDLRRRTAFLVRFVLPAVEALYASIAQPLRRKVMERTLSALRFRYPFAEGDAERLAAFVLRHQEDVLPTEIPVLAARLDLFPLERWLPGAPEIGRIFDLPFEGGQVDASLLILTEDVERVGGAVLTVLVAFASPDLAHEVAGRMLASTDPATRRRILGALRPGGGYPATPLGLEKALALTLAEEAPDLGDLARLALLLSQVRPSERLLPAAERLLAADDRAANLQGIALAKRLGRPTLIPALAGLLDSLDADLRDRALSAIQGIRELERLQAEAGGTR
jgi:hypothetical protein